jgi:hypothetical protein
VVDMHEKLKAVMGVETANCETCTWLGSDGDGWEYNGTWPVCNKIERMGYLKSFPFKKEMPCWWPDFWYSKFADIIKTADDFEMDLAYGLYFKALYREYYHMWC